MRSGIERIGRTVTVEFAQRSCLDKVRYPSRNAARDRAARLRTKYPNSQPLRPYRCTLCGDFHLTSKIPNGLRRNDASRVEPKSKRKGASP